MRLWTEWPHAGDCYDDRFCWDRNHCCLSGQRSWSSLEAAEKPVNDKDCTHWLNAYLNLSAIMWSPVSARSQSQLISITCLKNGSKSSELSAGFSAQRVRRPVRIKRSSECRQIQSAIVWCEDLLYVLLKQFLESMQPDLRWKVLNLSEAIETCSAPYRSLLKQI